MPLHRRLWLLVFSFSFLISFSLAQKPEVTVSRFENLPLELTYFEDSEVVVYNDALVGDVWISHNEGKDWSLAAGVPRGKALLFVLHPFHTSMAFILTQERTHYRTEDRGKTWHEFKVPVLLAPVANPLTFHSDVDKWGYIIFQGMQCDLSGSWWGNSICHDESYYTTDAFSSEPKLLLQPTRSCNFAHSSKDFKHSAHTDLIFCVGWDTRAADDKLHSRSSRLFSSTDFFQTEKRVVDFPGGNRNSDGVVAFAVVSKFAVAAMKDLTPGNDDEMFLFVTTDAVTWAKGRFPHASSSTLRENAYTIVESTTHSLAVDVLLHSKSAIGTLFVSNSNGTYFVESLQNTNRNSAGFVDFENIYGVEGIGLANIVGNAEAVDGRNANRELKSFMTFDDGSNWAPVTAPKEDVNGNLIGCDVTHPSKCSLHLHSVTSPHNFGRIFSSPAPGYVMGVGSVGTHLLPYDQCDTFLSTDAGATWRMVHKNAHQYEFGDQGSIMVIVDDEESVDHISYSYDSGNTWQDLQLGVTVRAKVLTTVPDSTSQKFLLIGTLSRGDQRADRAKNAAIFLDFATLRRNQCTSSQFEKWYAHNGKGKNCIMGHKQWYNRKIPSADCFVGDKFRDPVEHEDNCFCDDSDYECDFNYVRSGNECIPQGPEPVPQGVCTDASPGETYQGSSGYRLVPGNTCVPSGGKKKDDPVVKDCSKAQLPEGQISHQIFEFNSLVLQQEYFKNSQTILVRLSDLTVWQSSNEGYTWAQVKPGEKFLAFYHHRYASDRAYLLTDTNTIYHTENTGQTWNSMQVELPANTLNIPVMAFHPLESDWLIWIGSTPGCAEFHPDCRADAFYTQNNGRSWTKMESYVKSCAWARDTDLKIDSRLVICESYRDKTGSQALFGLSNPVELWVGSDFYRTKKTKLFNNVVGFAKFSEYLIVAELQSENHALDLQVSLDGRTFASGLFPQSMRPDNHAYTVLESTTASVFLHLTTSEARGAEYGNILKSNSNGTFYGVSVQNVNRNERGFVDFEKNIGIDGIAMVNVVSNTNDAAITRRKMLKTMITHNDGGSWKPLISPQKDSLGQTYPCTTTACSLNVHGYTERWDARATYSTPSVPGLMMAVGNVGEVLADYTESDTFLSRDAGFTWEEVHKDAHLWEFGDSGSILVMTNDEEATDRVLFSTDEGLNWREYNFGTKVRVKTIMTVPSDTSRKFILFGFYPQSPGNAVAVHVDFSSLTRTKCVLSTDNPATDDFELWSPSEEREENCLFGRKTLYHRRIRDRNCYVGEHVKIPEQLVHNCTCTPSDFECEFNYIRNADGDCVLGDGLSPLPSDDAACRVENAEFWYDRTAYRKIPHSSCEGGARRDYGAQHVCPGPSAHGAAFWWMIIVIPFGFTAAVAWWYSKSGLARGTIRLPDQRRGFPDSGVLATIASVPYFIVGLVGIAWESLAARTPWMRSRRGYRNVPVDEDAQVLHFDDEED